MIIKSERISLKTLINGEALTDQEVNNGVDPTRTRVQTGRNFVTTKIPIFCNELVL